MAEYIEREAVRDALYDADAITMQGVIILNQLPAADVVEVVHGHWVGLDDAIYADANPVYGLMACSECGEEVRGKDVPDTHLYCHRCGARMDGE